MLFLCLKVKTFCFYGQDVAPILSILCKFSLQMSCFSIAFDCFNALKMSGFNLFLLQINVSKTEFPNNGYPQVKALKTG